MQRIFIGIELDEDVRGRLSLLQGQLRRQLRGNDAGIKWVKADNIHLTLKFLGEVEDSLVPDLCRAVSEAAMEFESFDFDVDHIGCFPPHGSARVLWVGMGEGSQQLAALVQGINDKLAELGIEPEGKKFIGHLTLARIKNTQTGHAINEMLANNETSMDVGMQGVCEIKVIQSARGKDGPEYVTVHKAEIK